MRLERIHELDILRSFALVLLFLHHGGIYGIEVLQMSIKFLQPYIGCFIVGAFIFLAGYLSAVTIKKYPKPDRFRYLKSRFLRIYPPYLVALVLFILLLEVQVSLPELIVHILGLQVLLAPLVGTPIFTLWFVGMILLFFYQFFFLQLKFESISGLALSIILILGGSIILNNWFQLLEFRYFFFFPIFAVGILCERINILPVLMTSRFMLIDKLIIFILGTIFMALANNQTGMSLTFISVLGTDLFILTSIMLVLSLAKKVVDAKIGLSLFSFISVSSYFAFLFHRPIWKILTSFISFRSHNLLSLYMVIVGTPIVIIVSYYLQKTYNHILEFLNR